MSVSFEFNHKQEQPQQVSSLVQISVLVQIYRKTAECNLVGSSIHQGSKHQMFQESQSVDSENAQLHQGTHLLSQL